jgi:hypothetical protein
MTNEIALEGLATNIRAEHEACRAAAETATRHAIRCGQLLAQAKEGLVHGQWLPWLNGHCNVSERTAQAYMRLALKCGDMDDEKAQRVADLPIREALRAVADQRASVDLPCEGAGWNEVWEWAGRQIAAPFNQFDLDSVEHSCDALLLAKLCTQTAVPTDIGFALSMRDDKDCILRPIPAEGLIDTILRFKPVALQNYSDLDIDYAGLRESGAGMTGVLTLVAQRQIGFLFQEFKDRDAMPLREVAR